MINTDLLIRAEGFLEAVGEIEEKECLRVTTDSRKTDGKNAFIALYGEKFDGFSFIEELIKDNTLKYLIFQSGEGRSEQAKSWRQYYPNKKFILVDDVYAYILNLAALRVEEFKNAGGKLIGLTGSNGKTTNKEMLAYLICKAIGKDKVHYTKGNFNNHIGVPLTIFDIEDQHEVAIIEMGTNHPGEIEILCKASLPDFGMITNIGYAHIEYLKSLDGVLEEKGALYRSIGSSTNQNKLFILNGFDEKLKTLKKENWVKIVDEDNVHIKGNSFEIDLMGTSYKVSNPSLLGEHQQINMAMCISLAVGVFPDQQQEIFQAANSFKLKGMNRGELREYGELNVYLDAYNANPSSMMASLSSFDAMLTQRGIEKDRTLLILGDMNEIGDQAQRLHRETAQKAVEMGFSHFVFVGRYNEFYREGCGNGQLYKEAAQLKPDILDLVKGIDFIFIKGSRSLQLESILDIFKD